MGVTKLEYDHGTIVRYLSGGTLTGKTIEIQMTEAISTGATQYFLELDNGNYLKYDLLGPIYYYKHAGAQRTLSYFPATTITD